MVQHSKIKLACAILHAVLYGILQSMPKRSSRDANATTARVLEEVARKTESVAKPKKKRKNPAAVSLGRLGGLKGGVARAQVLSGAERSDIARRAALARWHGE